MADKRFCTKCGAANVSSIRVCARCGSRFETGAPPSARSRMPGTPRQPVRSGTGQLRGPETLPALIRQFITGFIRNLPNMIKGLIIAAVVSFVAVTLLHAVLMLLFPDGAPGTDIPGSILAVAGLQSSPTALIFWFLFAAIFAFIYAQVKSQGAKATGKKFAAMPAWIAGSVKTAGIAAFPLFMAGIAVAVLIRMFFLTAMTSIQFFILMAGVVFSQRESLAILAMRLGWSDINRVFKKTGPSIPAEAFPVTGVLGAAVGFLFIIFFADTVLAVEVAVGLLVVGSILTVAMIKRTKPAVAGPGRSQ
jgi:hypothetical protein